MRVGILTSHPIQYQAPWFRELAKVVDLEVFFAHRQSAAEQGRAGFGVAFEWDVDLLSGYRHRFLKNVSPHPGVSHYGGCDTPEIAHIIRNAKSRKQKAEISNADFSSQLSTLRFSPFDAFIVTGWYLKSYLQAVAVCRSAGVPVLVRGDSQLRTPRPLLKRFLMEIRQRWLLRKFAGFLSVGQRHTEYLRHFGVPQERIFFAPHFVDNEWFKEKAETARKQKAEIRKAWGADDSNFVALFVGKFIPKKRPTDVIRALSAFSFQLSALNPLAVFVGAGELENELRVLAAREKLRVHFAGFKNQTELPACYVAADVLVLPSDGGETWGLVVNEAMACGLPAIVSDAVGCAPDLIEEGRTGFTFRVGDTEHLAERLAAFARLKSAGREFGSLLAAKLKIYSVATAVAGTLGATGGVAGANTNEIPRK